MLVPKPYVLRKRHVARHQHDVRYLLLASLSHFTTVTHRQYTLVTCGHGVQEWHFGCRG